MIPLVPPIVLLGPPGAGKSTAGALLAQQLGFCFIDLDELAGVHHLVDEGLASFRVREHLALIEAIDRGAVVVAAGAGVVDTGPARELLARCLCLGLDVDVDTALPRLRAAGVERRPWLGALEHQRPNWLAREEHRPRHRAQLSAGDVDGRLDPPLVAAALRALVERSRCGLSVLDDVDDRLTLGSGFVIADSAVAERLERCDLVVDVAAGKGLAQVERMLQALVRSGRNNNVVVGVGGGTLLDLVGLAAALCHRGTPWRAVPTTLLAMVDAALGGKTAVDVVVDGALVRNAAGAFHPPATTCVWPGFLSTLSPAALRHGKAELLKHQLLSGGIQRVDVDDDAIRSSRGVKRWFVERDPRERHLRKALNLGHTFAHAFESRFAIAHGDAVLHGLERMLKLSVDVAGLDAAFAAQTHRSIAALGAPPLPALDDDDRAALLTSMRQDKKGPGQLVLLRAPGQPVLAAVDDDVLLSALI